MPGGFLLATHEKSGSCRTMKNSFPVLLLCFLLSSCGEEKKGKGRAEAGDAEAPLMKDSETMIRKILCLHGGGGDAKTFQGDPGITDLRNALGDDYEFVFAQAQNNGLWMRDPPRGKSKPTTDPEWASKSVGILNKIVADQGPFYGILGYSQGAAFIPVYLAQIPEETFQIAVMFGGYLPTTHQGLISRIKTESPFKNIPALVWMGGQDWIANANLASPFIKPTVLRSAEAGHIIPLRSDPTFTRIVRKIKSGS